MNLTFHPVPEYRRQPRPVENQLFNEYSSFAGALREQGLGEQKVCFPLDAILISRR